MMMYHNPKTFPGVNNDGAPQHERLLPVFSWSGVEHHDNHCTVENLNAGRVLLEINAFPVSARHFELQSWRQMWEKRANYLAHSISHGKRQRPQGKKSHYGSRPSKDYFHVATRDFLAFRCTHNIPIMMPTWSHIIHATNWWVPMTLTRGVVHRRRKTTTFLPCHRQQHYILICRIEEDTYNARLGSWFYYWYSPSWWHPATLLLVS